MSHIRKRGGEELQVLILIRLIDSDHKCNNTEVVSQPDNYFDPTGARIQGQIQGGGP